MQFTKAEKHTLPKSAVKSIRRDRLTKAAIGMATRCLFGNEACAVSITTRMFVAVCEYSQLPLSTLTQLADQLEKRVQERSRHIKRQSSYKFKELVSVQ